nr:uncharacterized protein LOC112706164 [Arachis hypogaea]
MVQEFTGIPSPPFSSAFSRRLDLLATSASLRSSSGVIPHMDFHPLTRTFAQSQSPSPSPNPNPLLFHHHNHTSSMLDAMASTTTASNNPLNFHLPPDLALPYHHMNLTMQNNNPTTTTTTPFNNVPAAFAPKSQPSLSMAASLHQDLHQPPNNNNNNAQLMLPPDQEHVASDEGLPSHDGRIIRSLHGNKVAY